jgi:hypothetical protein
MPLRAQKGREIHHATVPLLSWVPWSTSRCTRGTEKMACGMLLYSKYGMEDGVTSTFNTRAIILTFPRCP